MIKEIIRLVASNDYLLPLTQKDSMKENLYIFGLNEENDKYLILFAHFDWEIERDDDIIIIINGNKFSQMN